MNMMEKRDSSGSFFKRAVVSALGVALGSWLMDGIHYETNWDLFWVVLLLGVFSAILKPLLVLFALPFVVLTLGLGLLVINALLYLLVAQLVPGFQVDGFWAAFGGAFAITFLNLIFAGWISGGKRDTRFVRRGMSNSGSGGEQPRAKRIRKDDDVIDI